MNTQTEIEPHPGQFERHEDIADYYLSDEEQGGDIYTEEEKELYFSYDEDDTELADEIKAIDMAEEIGIDAANLAIDRKAKDLLNKALSANNTLDWETMDENERNEWRKMAVDI